jgi:putative addiction module component (TIGR02574 family)
MTNARTALLNSAMELTESERLLLATELMDTVPDDLDLWSLDDPDFAAELDRRAQDGTPGIPWETVRAELRADLES